MCEDIPSDLLKERQRIVAQSIKNGTLAQISPITFLGSIASIYGLDTLFQRAGDMLDSEQGLATPGQSQQKDEDNRRECTSTDMTDYIR